MIQRRPRGIHNKYYTKEIEICNKYKDFPRLIKFFSKNIQNLITQMQPTKRI